MMAMKSLLLAIPLLGIASASAAPESSDKVVVHYLGIFATNDRTVAVPIGKAKSLIDSVADSIGSHPEIEVKKAWVVGAQFNKRNVLSAIEALKVAPNDVVLVYANSHGFRLRDQSDPFPMLQTGHTVEESLSVSQMHDLLKQKGARLTLTFAECCNNFLDRPYGARPLRTQADERLAQLFVGSKGDLLFASSKPAEYSFALPEGGVFAQAFYHVFNRTISYGDEGSGAAATWENFSNMLSSVVAEKTKTFPQSQTGGTGQHPIHRINIDTSTPKKGSTGGVTFPE
jgi:hypothetical protein